MDYKIGDAVKISVYVTEEINGIYRVSNVKENRFILD